MIHHSSIKLLCVLLFGMHFSGCANKPSDADFAWPVPVKENRPAVYWWWPGSAVDADNITWNLETLREAGIGGVTVVPIYGVKGAESRFINYLTPDWLAMMDHTVKEAERLDMWVDMTTGSGWPFGGPGVSEHDADARVVFEGGQVSQRFSGRRVKRAAPGSEGFSVNPYYPKALGRYLQKFSKAFAENPIKMPRAQYHDSFEYAGNWSPDLFDEFQKRRGYDLRDHLPMFFAESEMLNDNEADIVSRIKSDYRETLSELHLEYIQTWNDWAHQQGCLTRNEAHGAPGNLLDLYAAADIPETEIFNSSPFDIPGLRRKPENIRTKGNSIPLVNRVASSAAHVGGKRLTASESFTWLRNHFKTSLSQIKPELDQLFLGGINHVIFHGSCYSPKDAAWPGWLFYASTEYNPRNAIWRDAPALNEYITRCQSILQSGKPDNDILLYWPVYDIWHDFDRMQQMLTVHDKDWILEQRYGDIMQQLLDEGYSYDLISDAQLQDVEIRDSQLRIGDGKYCTILVPKTDHMPVRTLQRLFDLAEQGATIIFDEALPGDVPGYGDLENRRSQYLALLEKVASRPTTGDATLQVEMGKGRLVVARDFQTQLEPLGVVRESMVETGVNFIRRTHAEGLHYFIANLESRPLDRWVALGATAQSAIVLDPYTGGSGVVAMRKRNGVTEVYLQLQPGETRILRTFTSRRVSGHAWPEWQPSGKPIDIKGTWSLEFVEGAPVLPAPQSMIKPGSWANADDVEVQRFAGAGVYRVEFELPPQDTDNWLLNLGNVRESARVRVNGQDAGVVWSIPFSLPIGKYLQAGLNVLEVEVTNLSANRIRDLDKREVEWQIFYDINFVNQEYEEFDASTWPVTDSGLLGPVTLTPMVMLNTVQ
jgi:hypothetical protein